MLNNQRLYILNNQDFSSIYDRPRFSDLERRHFFVLSEPELQIIKLKPFHGRETSSKLYFIIQLAYFKAKHLFFRFQYNEVEDDVRFVLNTHLPNDPEPINLPTRKFQLSAQLQILQLMGFQYHCYEQNNLIENKLSDIVCRTMIPIEIFEELKNTLEKTKVVLPTYSALQDAIGSAIKNEENRIIQIVQDYLTYETEQALQSLFAIEDVFYKITELKFDAKSFRTQEMQGELEKLQICSEIYLFSNTILPQVDISRKNIDYYANLAKTYPVYRLKRLPKALTYFYVTCYVHDRYEKIVNNLIKGFVYYVDKYNADSKKYATNNKPDFKAQLYENKNQIGELIRWYTDDDVMKEPGHLIQEKAYKLIAKDTMIHLSQALSDNNQQDIETALIWDFHKNNYRCILLNLCPLFLSIDFETNNKAENLGAAIRYLKEILKENKKLSDVDLKMIPMTHVYPKKLKDHFLVVYMNSLKKCKLLILTRSLMR